MVLSGCGGSKNRLNGSISNEATLAFDEVRVAWLVDQLTIQYLTGGTILSKDAVRLTLPARLAVPEVDIVIERQVRVEHFYAQGNQAGLIVTEKPFPEVEHGTLVFSQVGKKAGERVVGQFRLVFKGVGDTLAGDFDADAVPRN